MEDRMKGTPVGAGKPCWEAGHCYRSLPPPHLVWQTCAPGQRGGRVLSCGHLVAPFGAQGPATQPKEPQSGWPPG